MKKLKFKIKFDDSYIAIKNQTIIDIGTKFFSDANDLGKVVMLNVGESVDLDDGHQTVTRTQ